MKGKVLLRRVVDSFSTVAVIALPVSFRLEMAAGHLSSEQPFALIV